MKFSKKIIIGAICASMVCVPQALLAKDKGDKGGYVAGDFHNHTVFTDGAASIDRLIDESAGTYDLDWFIQSGHGGAYSRDGRYNDYNRNCIEDDEFGNETGEDISWEATVGVANIKGDNAGPRYCDKQGMWRWQSLMDYAYPSTNQKAYDYSKPIAQGYEYEVPGHEHCSHGNIAGQFDAGNANALAQFEYLWNYTDDDMTGGLAEGWGGKISNIGDGLDAGIIMHETKAVPAVEWLQANYPTTSYVVYAHIERKGKFNPDDAYGSGYNVEHFRDFNNAGPDVAFGWEGEPGHQASGSRGGFGSGAFGGTYGGVGFYSATIGNMWDALLGEGRNWWFFGSSDFHSRGSFHFSKKETTNDFWPGEYQKDYIYVENTDNPSPQDVIDGLRSGNSYVVQGDLIEELEFTVQAKKETATMGQKLYVKAGDKVKIKIKVRDPQGANLCPYSFDNPSLAQVGISQPINAPVLDHIDLIAGEVTGLIDPSDPDYTNPTNPTAGVIARFERNGGPDKNGFMTYVYQYNADKSMYFRLRGTNMPVDTPNETDADGNPLADSLAGNIECPDCPTHCNGVLNYDAEAWSDLWFTSNPIFVMVD
ncbi:conserved hypothetical protein [delta proteobacterium NaphS2]|nr:conserved hypothetical protein [delta proteobacterium NaphS2]